MAKKCTGNCFECENRSDYNEQDEILCPLYILVKRTNDLKEKHAEIVENQKIIIEMLSAQPQVKPKSSVSFDIEDEPIIEPEI